MGKVKKWSDEEVNYPPTEVGGFQSLSSPDSV